MIKIILAVALLLTAPISMAAGIEVQDAIGDVLILEAVSDPGAFSHADWSRASLTEPSKDSLLLIVTRATGDAPAPTSTVTNIRTSLSLDVAGSMISLIPYFDGCAPGVAVFVQGAQIGCADMHESMSSGFTTWQISIPKEFLSTSEPIRTGDVVSNLRGHSEWYNPLTDEIIYATDDFSADGQELVIALGDASGGDLAVSAEVNERSTNGANQVLAYSVNVTNLGAKVLTVALQAEAPSDWIITLLPTATIPPGESVNVPVLATIPFAHLHGHREVFTVRADDVAESSNWGSTELSVHWTSTPQPAGHHNQLFVHSRAAGSFDPLGLVPRQDAWMNTVQEDPGEETSDELILPNKGGPTFLVTGEQSLAWRIPLEPQLGIGLSARTEEVGRLEALFSTAIEGEAELESSLVYCIGLDCTILASASGIASGSEFAFDLDMVMAESFSDVQFALGGSLFFDIELTTNRPQNLGVVFDGILLDPKGTTLTLPLNEYVESVDAALIGVGGIFIELPEGASYLANPGVPITVPLVIKAPLLDSIELDVVGPSSLSWRSTAPVKASGGFEALIELELDSSVALGQGVPVYVLVTDSGASVASGLAKIIISPVSMGEQVIPAARIPVDESQDSSAPFIGVFLLLGLNVVVRKSRRD
jgi:hypothetical protein